MTEADPAPGDVGVDVDADVLDEVRQAAGAVIASLKRLLDASDRVIEDPDAFARVIEKGNAVAEAFAAGFAAQATPPADGPE